MLELQTLTLIKQAHLIANATKGPNPEDSFFNVFWIALISFASSFGLGGAADNLGAGGGHVISPSFTTVAPRTTSSSISTLR